MMEKYVETELESYVNSIKTLLLLANCHMVNFITENLFVNVLPKCIQDEVMDMSIEDLNDTFHNNFINKRSDYHNTSPIVQFLHKADMLSLKQSKLCCSVENLCEKLNLKKISKKGLKQNCLKRVMSEKKSYEVDTMSDLIASIAEAENCSHVVDIGGGKGYLSSILAFNHELKVLSVDSSLITTAGAAKHMSKVEKLVVGQHKSKITSCGDSQIKTEKNSSQLLRIATTYISENSDLVQLIIDNFEEEEVGRIMLTGLHTCGNLATSSLRLFCNHPKTIRCLVNVGCCYNLLIEEYDLTPSWLEEELDKSGFGFPISEYLKNLRFSLGRNARMLAAQPPDRLVDKGMFQTESLFYRALLECYLQKKFGSLNSFPQFRVGKLAKKCSSFLEYAQKSVKKLGLDVDIDERELQQLYDDHESSRKQLHALFLLRLALAPAVEAIIMLDRLMYLHEQGKEAYLTQLFDPVVSPRCFAIVAFNKTRGSD